MILLKFLAIAVTLGVVTCLPFKRVVNGGTPSEFDNRPWTAYLRKGTQRVACGATLVSPNWVVTAASCLKDPINAVILGDNDVTYDEGTEQYMEVAETVPHPDYNSETLENDIALIRLTAAAVLTDAVSPIPVMASDSSIMKGIDEDYIMGKHCRIGGWGIPDCLKINQFANYMKELIVDRVNDTDCDAQTGDRPSTALCFHPYRRPELASVCDGDAGGPYICKIRRVWHLVGVISPWNVEENCSKGLKGATKIIGYAPWIHSYIGATAEPEPMPVDPEMETTPVPTSPPHTPIVDPERKTTTTPTIPTQTPIVDPERKTTTVPEIPTQPAPAAPATAGPTTPAVATDAPPAATDAPVTMATTAAPGATTKGAAGAATETPATTQAATTKAAAGTSAPEVPSDIVAADMENINVDVAK